MDIGSIDDLPAFDRAPSSRDRKLAVYEIARLTSETVPHTEPPYKKQDVVSVIGRSTNNQFIFGVVENGLRENGHLVPFYDIKHISTHYLEKYEVLVPHDKLLDSFNERKIK